MSRPISTIFGLIAIMLVLCNAGKVRAQETLWHRNTVQPYLGAGIIFFSVSNLGEREDVGLSLEGGMRYGIFYAGISIANSGPSSTPFIDLPSIQPKGYIPPDRSFSQSFIYGLHGGFTILHGGIGLGVIILDSKQSIAHSYQTTFPDYGTTVFSSHSVSIGPDIRLQPARHLLLDVAYTWHMGARFGVDYLW